MIRFVYFDAGGTLISPQPSVGAVYARAGAPHGLSAQGPAMEEAFRKRWPSYTARRGMAALARGLDDEGTRGWWRELVFEVLDEIAFSGDRHAVFDACYSAFAEPWAWRIYEDALPTLEAFARRGTRMGILSNWDYRLRPLLEALKLSTWFDPVLISALEGLEKPDPRFFHHACAKVGLRPEEIAYVGDRLDLDLEPARAVGMRAFLIDRKGRSDSPHAIRSLEALVAATA